MNITELKAIMVRRGYTIPKLAEAIGISKKTLYLKFNGEYSFTLKEIRAIAKVLEMSPDELLLVFFDDKVA